MTAANVPVGFGFLGHYAEREGAVFRNVRCGELN